MSQRHSERASSPDPKSTSEYLVPSGQWRVASALIITGVLARLALYAYNYRGISLYCGDSNSYFGLANHLDWAAADRPSGFPFFLRLLLTVDSSPVFLLVVTGALGIAAQLLLWRALLPYVPCPRVGLLLNLLIFLNPIFLKINSMVFMADTLACFLLSVVLALLLAPTRRDVWVSPRDVLAMLVLGYLAIVKNAFVYFGVIAWLYLVFIELRERPRRMTRIGAAALLYGLAVAIIPVTYVVGFKGPRMGSYALEDFGGRSLLANLLAQARCSDLRDAAISERELEAINRHCRDERLRVRAAVLLWHGDSVMSEIETDLLQGHVDRVAGNRSLAALARRLLWKHPRLLVGVVWSNLSAHLRRTPRQQWTVDQAVIINGGCEDLVRTYFELEPEEYEDRWQTTANAPGLMSHTTADWLARIVSDSVDVLAFVAFLGVLAITPWRWRGRPQLILCIGFTGLYLAASTIGSYYDGRVYFVLNMLIYVTVAVALSRPPGPRQSRSTEGKRIVMPAKAGIQAVGSGENPHGFPLARE